MLIAMMIAGPLAGIIGFVLLVLANFSTGYAILIAWGIGIAATLLVPVAGRVAQYVMALLSPQSAAPNSSSIQPGDDSN